MEAWSRDFHSTICWISVLKTQGRRGRAAVCRESVLIRHDDNCQRAPRSWRHKSGTEVKRERVLWLEARLTFQLC